MEMGVFSMGTYQNGYPNNASFAYIYYLLLIYIFYYLALKIKIKKREVSKPSQYSEHAVIIITFVNLIFLVLMLFFFGGIKVWLGTVGKGEFRVSLGFFGFFAFIITKYTAPLFLAYLAACFEEIKKKRLQKILFYSNFILLFLIGSTWGYKTTALLLIMPSLIILNWKASFYKVLGFIIMAFVGLVLFSVLFDARDLTGEVGYSNLSEYTESYQGGGTAIEFVLYRATVLQGDVAWKVWDLYVSDYQFPSYFKTWLSIIGDKNLSLLFGIDRTNFAVFIQYHYGYLLTYIGGASLADIESGLSTTGTAFAEGIIAGGMFGLTVFSAIAGLMMGFLYKSIKNGVIQRQSIKTAFFAMYYTTVFLPWLTGGGILENFLHISIISGLVLSYYSLKYITKMQFI